jgi:hypothetical protein
VTITKKPGGGWITDETPKQEFDYLPVAGTIGMLGVTVELVMEFVDAYHLVVATTYVSRKDEEANWEQINASNRHLSYYYPGGTSAQSVRRNSWNLSDHTSICDSIKDVQVELQDHLLLAFFPKIMIKLAEHQADGHIISALNVIAPKITLPSYLAFARQLYYQHDEIEYGFPIANRVACLTEVMEMLQKEQFHCIVEVRFAPDTSQALLSPGTAGRGANGTCFVELAVALGPYGPLRIDEVYRKFERIITEKYGGRPHLGKKMYLNYTDMEKIYGNDWNRFQALRMKWDPDNKFLPPENNFLNTIFKKDL